MQDQIKGEVYELLCNKWMSIKAEDKMTRRHLQISATRKIEPGKLVHYVNHSQ